MDMAAHRAAGEIFTHKEDAVLQHCFPTCVAFVLQPGGLHTSTSDTDSIGCSCMLVQRLAKGFTTETVCMNCSGQVQNSQGPLRCFMSMHNSIDTTYAAALSVCQGYCLLQSPVSPTRTKFIPEQHLWPNPASADLPLHLSRPCI